jgi:CubicO group peptidase (beta-lactamase class C family)
MEWRDMGRRTCSTPKVTLSLVLVAAFCAPMAVLGNGDERGDVAARIDIVMTRLVPISEDQQPQRDQTAALSERMEFYRVPGIGIAVIDSYKLVWAGGYGTIRAGGDVPVDAGILFHAGSVAKPVSTAAILRLVEEGKLNLDANVNDALVSWKIPENEFTQQEKVTLRCLLSHSGGIEDGFTNRSSSDALPNCFTPEGTPPSVTIAELLDSKPGIDVDGPTLVTAVPGSQYRYANADYAIVELLVRDVTGVPFSSFMRITVLDPLGMNSSTYDQPLPASLRSRAAIEHDIEGKSFAGDRLHAPFLAAGGLWTTPSDLARFAIEIMNAYRGASERLLSHEMAQEMLSPQIPIVGNPLADAMALGFERSGSDANLAILHTGGTWGSTAVLWAHPGTGQGAIIMTNSATGSLLRFEILLAIAIEYGWPMVS